VSIFIGIHYLLFICFWWLFFVHSWGKSLSETCITLLCNCYYFFDKRGKQKLTFLIFIQF
jgi:hypothetical protein